MLRSALEGPDENFGNIIEEEISVWENGTKLWFLYAYLSCYMSSASDTHCSINFNYVFPIMRMSIR